MARHPKSTSIILFLVVQIVAAVAHSDESWFESDWMLDEAREAGEEVVLVVDSGMVTWLRGCEAVKGPTPYFIRPVEVDRFELLYADSDNVKIEIERVGSGFCYYSNVYYDHGRQLYDKPLSTIPSMCFRPLSEPERC